MSDTRSLDVDRVRALWRGKNSGPPIRRDHAGDARRVLEALVPAEAARNAVIELLILAILEANKAPRSWSLTLHPRCIRLNVGLVLVLDILPDTVCLVVPTQDASSLGAVTVSEDRFRSVSEPHRLVALPAGRVATSLPALREVLPRAIALAHSSARHSLHRRAWSPGVVEMLEDLTHRELPRPEWEQEPMTTPSATLEFIPSELDALRDLVEEPEFSTSELQQWRSRFLSRFGPDVLADLSGAALLEHMHGRTTQDSLVYWLEFKNDEDFNTRAFGSIAGGSALKFGLFQRAESNAWLTGPARDMRELTVDEAVRMAESQRDELLAAWTLVDALPDDLDDDAWEAMPETIADAAPTWGHLAFFHKTLALWEPGKVCDYHSLAYCRHVFARLGVDLGSTSLWAITAAFIRLGQQLQASSGQPLDLQQVTDVCNRRYGAPHGHWRVGTTENDEDRWPPMLAGDHVGIGWDPLGDLNDLIGGLKSREARDVLRARIRELWPTVSASTAGKAAAQIWRFYDGIQEGDLALAAKGQQVRGVGRVTGDYRYDPDAPHFKHRRSVRWLCTESFKSPSNTGLLTTVYNLSNAHDIQAAAWRQIAARPSEQPALRRARSPREIGPIEEQLDRKGQVLLYGPPGTGKTYNAIRAARALVAHDVFGRPWAELSDAERAQLEHGEPGRRIWMCTFHPAFSYEDFVEGLKPTAVDGQLSFAPRPGVFRRICERARDNKDDRFVLIIDEFNRGDAPRIFGELLTLLELDKRDTVSVTLPTSGEMFTVPRNVRIIATMNTSDRSIAHLDAALRRRFGFLEFLPDPDVIGHLPVRGLSMAALMTGLNERLVQHLGPRARNLQIGHSFFLGCKSVHTLRSAFQYDILPLIQEYCADDPVLLEAILGKALYDRGTQRIRPGLFRTGAEDALLAALRDLGDFDVAADEPDEVELDDAEDVVDNATA